MKLKWTCTLKNHKWTAEYRGVKSGNGFPHCIERKRAIGVLFHPIFEYLCLKYLISKGCSASYEEKINEGSIPDLLIIRNQVFIDQVENHQSLIHFPANIDGISIDCTFSTNPFQILKKCGKGYQAERRFLLIVLLHDRIDNIILKTLELIQCNNHVFIGKKLKKIDYSNHIKVVDFNTFLRFLHLTTGLDNWNHESQNYQISKSLQSTLKLAKNAIISDFYYDILIKKYYKYRKLLKVFS